ncbi:transcriptional regulator ATRX homolog isoform X2 [Ptychodera flava]
MTTPKRIALRWTVQQDVDLLKEVVASRPDTSAEWQAIANNLMSHWSWAEDRTKISPRSVREHADLLLSKFKENDKKSMKKSGTEEQYNELQQLCQEVLSYVESHAASTSKEVVASKKKHEQRQQALAIRETAMKRMTETAGNNDQEEHHTSKKQKVMRSSKSELFSYLQQKHEVEMKYKQDALEVEKKVGTSREAVRNANEDDRTACKKKLNFKCE